MCPRLWTALDRGNGQQHQHYSPRDKNAAELTQNEFRIWPAPQPPVGRDPRAVPARMVERVGLLFGFEFFSHQSAPEVPLFLPAPRGHRYDLNHSSAVTSLYCWIAPAGSTCL